jgi:beta-N-acetylhexosaminidase
MRNIMCHVKTVLRILLWLTLLGSAVVLTALYETPRLGRFREPLLILAVSLFGVLVLAEAVQRLRWRSSRFGSRWLRGGTLVVLFPCAFLMVCKQRQQSDLRQRIVAKPANRVAEIGRHVIVGYRKVSDVVPLVKSGAVGGVFITTRNLRGRTLSALRTELAMLQTLRKKRGLPPLFVATDQEGGEVSRLSPWLTALPALARSAALSQKRRIKAVQDYGRIHGRELASLGVNLNFAPVVDLKTKQGERVLSLFSQISDRAIHSSPERVKQVAELYGEQLRRYGVVPTLKHFPGLGSVATDTHLAAGRITASVARLSTHDWVPFALGSAQRQRAMMLAHVFVERVDKEYLASSSKTLVSLVRKRGYRGLLVTDDMCMTPVWKTGGGFRQNVVRSLAAGVDLILISADPRQVYPALDALLNAAKAGKLDRRLLKRSVERLNRVLEASARLEP